MELTKIELKEINGGAITATMINALTKVVTTFFTVGKSVGSAIRSVTSKNKYCKI